MSFEFLIWTPLMLLKRKSEWKILSTDLMSRCSDFLSVWFGVGSPNHTVMPEVRMLLRSLLKASLSKAFFSSLIKCWALSFFSSWSLLWYEGQRTSSCQSSWQLEATEWGCPPDVQNDFSGFVYVKNKITVLSIDDGFVNHMMIHPLLWWDWGWLYHLHTSWWCYCTGWRSSHV